jgi:soluble lytic murein transglycosylase-like protein
VANEFVANARRTLRSCFGSVEPGVSVVGLVALVVLVGIPLQGAAEERRSNSETNLGPRPYPQGSKPEPFRPTRRTTRGAKLFQPIILTAALKYQVDPALIHAIILAESSYNPRAISKKGAKGLMQLMPSTAAALGVKDAFDPEHNVNGGAKYLRHLLDHFEGDLQLVIAAYNAGMRKVKKYNGIPPYKTTRSYVKKVFQYYRYFKERMKPTSRPS